MKLNKKKLFFTLIVMGIGIFMVVDKVDGYVFYILLVAILLFVISCNRESKGDFSNKEIQKLYEREKKSEIRAKYGGEKSKIEVISDSAEVEKLKKYITEKNSEKKELEERKVKSLSERYMSGDKAVVPIIVKTLSNGDVEKRKELYNNLEREYDESEEYTITEPELINAILKNISNPEDEKFVIQLAGFMKLDGYPDVFEERLFSGKSKDENRLIYWLGIDGKSEKTVQYIEKLLSNNKFDFEKNDYVMSGLEGFAENGNTDIQRRVFEICLDIYNRQLIPKEKFKEMKSSWSSTNPAISLTEILLESDDVRVIPIAKQCIQENIRIDKALATLVNIEGDKHRELVLELLKSEDNFFTALYSASKLYKISKDKSIVETILIQFEKRGKYEDSDVNAVVSEIVAMGANEYFSNLDKILKNEELINSIVKHYNLINGSVESVAEDLYELGVVDKPVSQRAIGRAKKISFTDDTRGFVYDILTVSGVYQSFDAETDEIPVNYDDLIVEFVKNSNGKLKDIDVWMDVNVDKDYNAEYKIFVSANNKIYIMLPEDIGDWYDVEIICRLMNTIVKDANLKERYISMDTGDQFVQILFGPVKNVNQFIEKYKL